MSEPVIRTGDIPALSKAITQVCEAVSELTRHNMMLVESVNSLSERVAQLEGENAALTEGPKPQA